MENEWKFAIDYPVGSSERPQMMVKMENKKIVGVRKITTEDKKFLLKERASGKKVTAKSIFLHPGEHHRHELHIYELN